MLFFPILQMESCSSLLLDLAQNSPTRLVTFQNCLGDFWPVETQAEVN